MLLTLLLLGLSLALTRIGEPLVTAEAPYGIVSFELAGSHEAAAHMIASWDAAARQAAMLCLGLDFLYLLVYPAWFSLVCWMLAARLDGLMARSGRFVGRAVWLAAPLDALENYSLIRLLEDGPSRDWARLAAACAVPKFALVAVALAFLLVGGAVSWRRGTASVHHDDG